MNSKNLMLVILSMLLLNTACSKGGGSAISKAGSLGAASLQHKANECPLFQGNYLRNGVEEKKVFASSEIANGIRLEDSGIVWLVDGKAHMADAPEAQAQGANYVASCSAGSIVILLYRSKKAVGEIRYAAKFNGEIEISGQIDGVKEPAEIWKPENKQ